MNENELQHFGIPGMKWGQRKQPERSGNGRVKKLSRRQQRKNILRDYNLTKDVKTASYNSKLMSGKLKGNEKHPLTQTYDSMVKKYGKESVNDALKYRNKKATRAAMAVTGMSMIPMAAILASSMLKR